MNTTRRSAASARTWLAFAWLACIGTTGCRASEWRDELDAAVEAQCERLFTCGASASVSTWFGDSGATREECVETGTAYLDEWEDSTDTLWEWGGCSEEGSAECLSVTESQTCTEVREAPSGVPECRGLCDYPSVQG